MTEEIKSLTDYQHIRLRPGMYIGSVDPHTQDVLIFDQDYNFSIKETTWVPAIYTAFREILDNALDEVVGYGYGNRVDITFDVSKLSFSVSDNGRGIPLDKATIALTEPRTGRNFGAREAVAGMNGIGASAVSISSESFEIDIHRDGKHFVQHIREGNGIVDTLQIDRPKVSEYNGTRTGTKITFTLSRELFKHREITEEFIISRLVELAAVHREVNFYLNGTKVKTAKTTTKTLFKANDRVIVLDVEEQNFESTFYLLPGISQNGDAHYHSVVNNIPTFQGGTHIDAFRRSFVSNLLNALEKESKKRKLTPNRTDVLDGLLVYNVTKMHAPNFDSQSKTRLINEEVGKIITKFFNGADFYKDFIRKNKVWIDEIYKRCELRTHAAEVKDLEKEGKKLSRKKLPKLMEANSKNRMETILLLTEGDSAVGDLSSVRDPLIHAALPLCGKVLNVNGESPKRVIESQALVDIMVAIGLQMNQTAVREQLRYGKIYIAHDEDPDGKNIGALLVNFLYTYWPELFSDRDNPFVNVFMTPYIIAAKGKVRKYWYSHNYAEFDVKEYKGWAITRAKGLAALTEDDWRHAINNPELYSLYDDGRLIESLDLIFNNGRADDRKAWIGM